MFDKIMKILTITEEVDSIDNYRASGPLFELGKSDGYEVDIASRNFAYSKIFRKYDIFYLQRPRSIDLETACLAKKFGLKLVVDYDDDLFNVPVHNPAHLGLHSEEIDCMRDVTLEWIDCMTNVALEWIDCMRNVALEWIDCMRNVALEWIDCMRNVTLEWKD